MTFEGEYLFDHRNGSMLTEWLLKEYILSDTSLGSPFVDGMFIDDFWCSKIINGSLTCNDPVQGTIFTHIAYDVGPSEIDKYSKMDMGLTNEDIVDILNGWLHNMEVVQEAILNAGGYTWSLIPNQDNANAMPNLITNSTLCITNMQTACNVSNPYLTAPLLAGLTYNSTLGDFPYLEQQVAAFLLMRGDRLCFRSEMCRRLCIYWLGRMGYGVA